MSKVTAAGISRAHHGPGCGVDLGGTCARMKASMLGNPVETQTRDHGSLYELLEFFFSEIGYVPRCLVLAAPGGWQVQMAPDGTQLVLRCDNIGWDPVEQTELKAWMSERGIRFSVVNDLQASQYAARELDMAGFSSPNRGVLYPIWPWAPDKMHPCDYGNLGVLTVSTGFNGTIGGFGPREDLAIPLELGRGRLPVPATGLTHDFDRFARGQLKRDCTIEDALSGPGVGLLVDYLLAHWSHLPSGSNLDAIKDCPLDERSQRMTVEAMNGEPFWAAVAQLFGELLGYTLGSIAVSHNISALLLQGSVLNGTQGFLEWLCEQTPFLACVSDWTRGGENGARGLNGPLYVYGVNDGMLGVAGAYALAVKLSGEPA